MSFVVSLLPNKPISTFSIIKVSTQLYPEIEPNFVVDHRHLIKNVWHVLNNDGNHEKIEFNKDYVHPLITKGWKQFKDLNNLADNVEVEIECHGPTMFKMTSHNIIHGPHDLKKWHSRYINPVDNVFFDIPLDMANIGNSKLKLPFTFAKFLKKNFIYDVLLCGDDGGKEHLSVIKITDPTKTSLGHTWNDFARLQWFEVGDVIRFIFDLHNSNGKCRVYRNVDFNNTTM